MSSIPVITPAQMDPDGRWLDQASGMLMKKLQEQDLLNQHQQNINLYQNALQHQDLQKAILANEYQKLQNQYYGQDIKSQIGLRGAQSKEANALANLNQAQVGSATAHSAADIAFTNRLLNSMQNSQNRNPVITDNQSNNPTNYHQPLPMSPEQIEVLKQRFGSDAGNQNSDSINSYVAGLPEKLIDKANDAEMDKYLTQNSDLYNYRKTITTLNDPINQAIQSYGASRGYNPDVNKQAELLKNQYPGADAEQKLTDQISQDAQNQIGPLQRSKYYLDIYRAVANKTKDWQYIPGVQQIATKLGIPIQSKLQVMQGIATLLTPELKSIIGTGPGFSQGQQELGRLQRALGDPHNIQKPTALAENSMVQNLVDNGFDRVNAINNAIGKYKTYKAIKYPGFNPKQVAQAAQGNYSGNMVRIIGPDGRAFKIPSENLQAAIKRGAREG